MKQRKSEINWKLVVRVACLMLLDVMLLYLACLLALLSRFDLSIHTLMRDSGFLPALHAAFPWVNLVFLKLSSPLFFLFLLLLQVLFTDAVFQVRFLKISALYIDCHSQKHDYQGNTHDGHAVRPFIAFYTP